MADYVPTVIRNEKEKTYECVCGEGGGRNNNKKRSFKIFGLSNHEGWGKRARAQKEIYFFFVGRETCIIVSLFLISSKKNTFKRIEYKNRITEKITLKSKIRLRLCTLKCCTLCVEDHRGKCIFHGESVGGGGAGLYFY